MDDDPLSHFKGTKMVLCRICKGGHWTTKCPYKDSLPALPDLEGDKKKPEDVPPAPAAENAAPNAGQRTGKYVPPSLRAGGNAKGESMTMKNRGECKFWFCDYIYVALLLCFKVLSNPSYLFPS